MLSARQEKGELTSTDSPVVVPRKSDIRAAEQPQRPHGLGHQCTAVRRSNTAPATYEHVLPIASAQTNAGSPAKGTVDSRRADAQPWAATIHIHLNRDRPHETEVCRCMLDTGSDLNLVSQRTLRNLKLQFTVRKGPTLTGLGNVPIVPVGFIMLTWHVNRHEGFTYHDQFWVISDDVQPLFDVLLGKHWIKDNKALLPNPEILLMRCVGWNFASSSVQHDA